MSDPELFAVALNVPAGEGVFTYRIAGGAQPGRRVLVPLGKRSATGIVLGPGEPAEKVRDALRLLDDGPLVTEEVLALCRFASQHYLYPLGPALKAALPPGLELKDAFVPRLTEAGRAFLQEGQLDLPGQEETVRRALRKSQSGAKLSRRQLEALQRQGLVTLVREEPKDKEKPLVELAEAVASAAPADLRRSPRQAELLAWLLARGGAVPVEELLAAFPGARPQLRGLVARKLAKLSKVPAGAAQQEDAPWGSQDHTATAAQAAALGELRKALESGGFAPFLLHGVTGSGKTWVYLEAIALARARGLGALVLVPEIALTPQLAGRFRARFGDDVAVLHSGLSERERQSEWMRVHRGDAGIVVGARSAVWAPVSRLGIVVVDEEHEPSYKQEDRLRYHARDLALVRAQKAGALCVLGSATPSLETLRRAQEGKLPTLLLPERVDSRALPALTVVKRAEALLTPELLAALRETLERREQAILFLNKRGHTRTLLCMSCGSAVGCPNCSVALVLHRHGSEKLRCHLCAHEEPVRSVCSACGGKKLVPLGGGTEKVEEELAALLPGARLQRLDRDSASGPGQAAAVLARFARREIDVLIGTQMVAKGHDFPGVTLVGVLDADGPLHLPDPRAAERCVQLLTQVAGRAGRGSAPGRVILQAFKPGAVSLDYAAFAAEELTKRAALKFPPFARLLALRLQGNVEQSVRGAAERLAVAARRYIAGGIQAEVLGPAPAPIARLRGKFRYHLLLRADGHGPLHRLGRALQDAHAAPGVELALDVDPVSFL